MLSLHCVSGKHVPLAWQAHLPTSLPPPPFLFSSPSIPSTLHSQVLVDCTQPEGEQKTPEAAFARKRDALLRILTGGLSSSSTSASTAGAATPAAYSSQQQQQRQMGAKWERRARGGEEREVKRRFSESSGAATEGRAEEHMKTIVFCNKVTKLCC